MSDHPTLEEIFSALAHEYRRQLLVALLEHDALTGTEVSHYTHEHVGEKELDRLKLEMVHTHFPKLEEMGVIQWDSGPLVVRRGPQFEEIQPLLELLQNHANELPDDWP